MSGSFELWPKAELHLHLEGTVSPETLSELAPSLSSSEAASHYVHEGFLGFLDNFKRVNQKLTTPEHYGLIARRCFGDLRRQNILYAEITVSAGVILWKRHDLAGAFDALAAEAAQAEVEIRWILDAVRQLPVEDAWRVAEFAAANRDRGVIAFGLGGDEARGCASLFQEVCRWARKQGLRLTLHAGESAGPESVWRALEAGSERIGHGVRAIEDPVLVEHLAAHRVPLEVCLSSNVLTGAVPDVASHPARAFYDAGVPITLNTDDPAFFHTTLAKEYALAQKHLGIPTEQLEEVAGNAFRFAFDAPAAALMSGGFGNQRR